MGMSVSFQRRWQSLPATIRKPLVLIVGILFVIAAPFAGVLPGPGGIPVFLIGIAILATEYDWARRLRDWTLQQIQRAGQVWREHKIIVTLLCIAGLAVIISASILGFRYLKTLL